MGDLMQGFSLALSLLSLALGAINLAISGQGTAILRRLALINVLWLAGDDRKFSLPLVRHPYRFPRDRACIVCFGLGKTAR